MDGGAHHLGVATGTVEVQHHGRAAKGRSERAAERDLVPAGDPAVRLESGGLYSIRPDGTDWTLKGSSAGVTYLAWQPLTER